MRKIAIFASGSGTNAGNIIKYFSNGNLARVDLILSNSREAFVLKRAEALKVDSIIFDRDDFYVTGKVLEYLRKRSIDFVVLAGFLWMVPGEIIDEYQGRIINIHPALLPLHGGRGMYGEKVHRAVIENHEKESGITIHYVNRLYDKGEIIFQAKCKVSDSDTPDSLAGKVHSLEYEHYPKVIEELIRNLS